ncbi:Adhesion G-protein coupled receptor G2, partial [Bulinus truncatus]
CNDRVIEVTYDEYSIEDICFEIGEMELTWHQAYHYCHKRQGWLANTVNNLKGLNVKLLADNSVTRIWSGHHIKNNRLLVDHFPTVEKLASTENISFNTTLANVSNCLLLVYNNNTCYNRPEDKIPHCGPSFVEEFVPCDDRNVFVCKFDAVELGQPAMLSLRADLYVTHNVSTYYKMDEACEAIFKDGRTYRLRDMQTLSEPFFVSSSGTESIFWVRSKGQQCTAVTVKPPPANIYQSEAVGVASTVQMMNWPCNKSLPVLCELDKTYDVTPPPTVTVNSYGSQIIVLNDQILVPSYILKLMTSQSNNMASQTQATNYFNLFCNISSSLTMSQKITLFSNFIPFFTESHIEPGLIPFRWQNMKKLDSEYLDFSMIEFNHYYHCEVNDLNSSTVLQSEHIFVRLSDYEIYSVHISLSNVSNTVVNLELVMFNASLRNQWNAVEPDLLYTTTNPHPEVSKSTSAIVNSTLLQVNTTVTGWPTNFSTAFLVNISTSHTVTSTEFHNRSSSSLVNSTSVQTATEVVDSDIKLDLNFLKSALRNLTTLQPQLNFSVRPQLFNLDCHSLIPIQFKCIALTGVGQKNKMILSTIRTTFCQSLLLIMYGKAQRSVHRIKCSTYYFWKIRLEVWDLSQNYATEPVVGLKLMANGDSENLKSEDITSLFSELNLNFNELLAAIVLPKTLIELLVNGQEITDLGSERVATYFLPNKQFKESVRSNLTSCSYWDFNAYHGAGGWNNTGCTLQPTVEGRDVCFCSHLTNFAVLMSFYDQGSLINENELALTIISIIGLSLSIAGLSLSVMSFIFIKSLHHSRPQQTLFQLSLALISSWIVFLAGITQTSSHAGCIVVAVLLHYFILASFMWMLMEGILQYLLFVKVLNSYFSHYMWKTAIPAWGFPLLPVIITLSIDRNLYKGGSKYCWLSLDAFYYGFAIPVGLIILANIFLFIMVVISLCNRKDMSKYSSVRSNQTLVNIRASFICFCLLGLTWIFGFLAIDDARIVFQYLFCIFNSLQGFVIFMMMTVRDKNVRSFWHSKLSSCLKPSKKRAGASSETSPADSAVDSRTVRSNNTTNINFSNDDYQRVEIMQPHRMDISTPNDD